MNLSLENRSGGGGRKGVSQSFGNVNHPCIAVWIYPVFDTHTSSDRKLSYSGQSQYELRQEYSFLLCRFLYTINFTTLSFSVIVMVSLKKNTVTFILA